MSADTVTEPLRETRYVKDLAKAKAPSRASKKSFVAIERIFVKKSKQVDIRFSAWGGKRMLPRALGLPEEELLPLMALAIRSGVFSEEFTAGLRRVLAESAPVTEAVLAENAPELARIEAHFHALIRSRGGDAVDQARLVLPAVQADAETQDDPLWFPIESMQGGFRYWWDASAKRLRLMSESWSSTAGTGQLHEITAAGARLLGEGFV